MIVVNLRQPEKVTRHFWNFRLFIKCESLLERMSSNVSLGLRFQDTHVYSVIRLIHWQAIQVRLAS